MSFAIRTLIILTTFAKLIQAEDSQCSINGRKAINVVDEKFLSVSVDPTLFFSEIQFSSITDDLARHFLPAYLRIAGPSTPFIKFTEDDQKATQQIEDDTEQLAFGPSKWWALNRWIKQSNFTPVFALNDRETIQDVWAPKNTLPLLDFTARMNVDCYWQLGYDSSNKSEKQYKQDLTAFRNILDAFPNKKSVWRIVGEDLSKCVPSKQVDVLYRYLEGLDTVDAVMWEPDDENQAATLQVDTMHKFLNIYEPETAIWTSAPKLGHPVYFADALDWAVRVGESARNGFDVVYRQPRLHEFFTDTPIYWLSLLHKQLMGRNVLNVKTWSLGNLEARIYAHCSKNQNDYSIRGAMTIMMVNNGSSEHKTALRVAGTQLKNVDVRTYTITSHSLNSTETLLNGEKLSENLLSEHTITFNPIQRIAKATTHLTLTAPPKSVVFFVLPAARIPVCISDEDDTNVILEAIEEEQNTDLLAHAKQSPLSNLYQNLEREIEEDDIHKYKTNQNVLEKKSDEPKLKSTNLNLRNVLPKDNETKPDLKLPAQNLFSKLDGTMEKDTKRLSLSSDEILKLLKDRAKAKVEKRIGLGYTDLDVILEKAFKNKMRVERDARGGGHGRGGGSSSKKHGQSTSSKRKPRDINMKLLKEKLEEAKKSIKKPTNLDKKSTDIFKTESQKIFGSDKQRSSKIFPLNEEKPHSIFKQRTESKSLFGQHEKPKSIFGQHDKHQSIFTQQEKPQSIFGQHDKAQSIFDQHEKPQERSHSIFTQREKPIFEEQKTIFAHITEKPFSIFRSHEEKPNFGKIFPNLPILQPKEKPHVFPRINLPPLFTPNKPTAGPEIKKISEDFLKEAHPFDTFEDFDDDVSNPEFYEEFGREVTVIEPKNKQNYKGSLEFDDFDDFADNSDLLGKDIIIHKNDEAEVEKTIKRLENFFNRPRYESGRNKRDIENFRNQIRQHFVNIQDAMHNRRQSGDEVLRANNIPTLDDIKDYIHRARSDLHEKLGISKREAPLIDLNKQILQPILPKHSISKRQSSLDEFNNQIRQHMENVREAIQRRRESAPNLFPTIEDIRNYVEQARTNIQQRFSRGRRDIQNIRNQMREHNENFKEMMHRRREGDTKLIPTIEDVKSYLEQVRSNIQQRFSRGKRDIDVIRTHMRTHLDNIKGMIHNRRNNQDNYGAKDLMQNNHQSKVKQFIEHARNNWHDTFSRNKRSDGYFDSFTNSIKKGYESIKNVVQDKSRSISNSIPSLDDIKYMFKRAHDNLYDTFRSKREIRIEDIRNRMRERVDNVKNTLNNRADFKNNIRGHKDNVEHILNKNQQNNGVFINNVDFKNRMHERIDNLKNVLSKKRQDMKFTNRMSEHMDGLKEIFNKKRSDFSNLLDGKDDESNMKSLIDVKPEIFPNVANLIKRNHNLLDKFKINPKLEEEIKFKPQIAYLKNRLAQHKKQEETPSGQDADGLFRKARSTEDIFKLKQFKGSNFAPIEWSQNILNSPNKLLASRVNFDVTNDLGSRRRRHLIHRRIHGNSIENTLEKNSKFTGPFLEEESGEYTIIIPVRTHVFNEINSIDDSNRIDKYLGNHIIEEGDEYRVIMHDSESKKHKLQGADSKKYQADAFNEVNSNDDSNKIDKYSKNGIFEDRDEYTIVLGGKDSESNKVQDSDNKMHKIKDTESEIATATCLATDFPETTVETSTAEEESTIEVEASSKEDGSASKMQVVSKNSGAEHIHIHQEEGEFWDVMLETLKEFLEKIHQKMSDIFS